MAYDQQVYDQGLGSAQKAYHDKYAGAAIGADVEETAFGAVSNALDRSNLLSHRVQQLADRLLGSVPTPVSDAPSNKPSAVFPTMRQAAYETQAMAQDALNALDRIERALP